jgi:hypothetical protein
MNIDIEVVKFLNKERLIDGESVSKYKESRKTGYDASALATVINDGLSSLSEKICGNSIDFRFRHQQNENGVCSWNEYTIIFEACDLLGIERDDDNFIETILAIFYNSLDMFPEFLLAPMCLGDEFFNIATIESTFFYRVFSYVKNLYCAAVNASDDALASRYMKMFNMLYNNIGSESDEDKRVNVNKCVFAIFNHFFSTYSDFRRAYDEWCDWNNSDDESEVEDCFEKNDNNSFEIKYS